MLQNPMGITHSHLQQYKYHSISGPHNSKSIQKSLIARLLIGDESIWNISQLRVSMILLRLRLIYDLSVEDVLLIIKVARKIALLAGGSAWGVFRDD